MAKNNMPVSQPEDSQKPRKSADAELKMMAKLWPQLASLPNYSRKRVLDYLNSRHQETLEKPFTLEAVRAAE